MITDLALSNEMWRTLYSLIKVRWIQSTPTLPKKKKIKNLPIPLILYMKIPVFTANLHVLFSLISSVLNV